MQIDVSNTDASIFMQVSIFCKCRVVYYSDMLKATLRNVAFSLVILSMVLVVLVAIDNAGDIKVSQKDTYLRVYVVDLDDKPVHNAQITIGKNSFFTDNKGLSPTIQLSELTNSYDSSVTDWYTVNVVIKKEGYVPTVVFNCVVFDSQTRRLTVKVYQNDASALPYVCYVESPPSDFVIKEIVK